MSHGHDDMDNSWDEDEARRAEQLLADLAALQGSRCQRCPAELCGHELTMSLALGFKAAPICLLCFSKQMDRSLSEMREDVFLRVTRRDCFLQGWLQSSRVEGYGQERRPPCLWPQASQAAVAVVKDAEFANEETRTDKSWTDAPRADESWDAGDMSCGDLVLELRGRLYALEPGAVLALRATDRAAPEDIPAWCRVTRNPLIQSQHPHYWIRRKDS